ncbi:hypothetical protein [Metabacillus fastidiosus]|uniref:hypothetical protein n=1 Tax=Metabacillus fastidiosus TaxID=1458 RepID=UPI002DB97B16|nr:hypothetical protein [Metabacillus fastidiosus]MEC2077307.1 hypothetical protein [Metabacillus fastidiosus]
MNLVEIDESHSFSWRLTSWDEAVFEKKTAELMNFKFKDFEGLRGLFGRINQIVDREKLQLVCLRYNSRDQIFKKLALEHGFNIVEQSYYVTHNKINKIPIVKKNLTFRRPGLKDIPKIQRIAKESFEFGRFHEDPFVDIELAKKRYENWILNLIEETQFYVLDVKGEVAGFFNYVIKENYIDLPLSGIDKQFSGIGSFMWHKMFNFINEVEDVRKAKILISSSNLDVLNLYMIMGFKVKESMFGYHKHIKR